ncbi:MAG: nitroreductase family protein [Deltaproteobacteria bacterium]|nr:nitroreductase family protein [Deltaproteobacteria bacterium]MBI3075506.1 nitroreductase family protein [Deltaproteobacteria bacterium]
MAPATTDYDVLLDLVRTRMSVRRLKPDPIPEDAVDRILETARWAMSGANSQPWEFIVVRDPAVKRQLYDAYVTINAEYIFWVEQQRVPELRHPSFQQPGAPEEQLRRLRERYGKGWSVAPALIVVLGDGRKQWGTVAGAHTFGRFMSHLTDGLANTSQLIHLAAASLGLGAQWVSIHVQEPFKRILDVPDLLMLYLIIPIGYPDVERRPGVRHEVKELVHYDRYDRSRYLTDAEAFDYLQQLRGQTIAKYATSYGQKPGEEGAGR